MNVRAHDVLLEGSLAWKHPQEDLGTEQNAHPHLFLRESWIRWWGLVATNPPTKDHTPGRVVMIG